jgi:hypothetical protein
MSNTESGDTICNGTASNALPLFCCSTKAACLKHETQSRMKNFFDRNRVVQVWKSAPLMLTISQKQATNSPHDNDWSPCSALAISMERIDTMIQENGWNPVRKPMVRSNDGTCRVRPCCSTASHGACCSGSHWIDILGQCKIENFAKCFKQML